MYCLLPAFCWTGFVFRTPGQAGLPMFLKSRTFWDCWSRFFINRMLSNLLCCKLYKRFAIWELGWQHALTCVFVAKPPRHEVKSSKTSLTTFIVVLIIMTFRQTSNHVLLCFVLIIFDHWTDFTDFWTCIYRLYFRFAFSTFSATIGKLSWLLVRFWAYVKYCHIGIGIGVCLGQWFLSCTSRK